MTRILNVFLGTATLAAMIRLSTPLVLAAMGGVFGDKSGVFNIALESFMLTSAFFAMYGSYIAESAMVGLLFGVVTGLIMSAIFGFLVLHCGANSTVVGIALNMSSWGFTTLLLTTMFHTRGAFMDPSIVSFPTVHISLLDKIPYLNDILNNQNVLVYVSWISVIVCWIVMYKTPFGLRLRGVGINEQAAQTTGINVVKYRWIALLATGAMVGVAGAFLPLCGISMFTENMTAGKGFLAVAAIMIGKGNPAKVFLSCMLFAYADAVSIGLQAFNIPSQAVMTLPYLATVIVLFVSNFKNSQKAALEI